MPLYFCYNNRRYNFEKSVFLLRLYINSEVNIMSNINDETMMFNFGADDDKAAKALCHTCRAMLEKGYSPINQLVGYLLSDDPAYITSHKNARNEIRRLGRDELLEELVRFYLENNENIKKGE